MTIKLYPHKLDLQISDDDLVDVPKPKIIDSTDVILKVTGSTICGSDLHLYHGMLTTIESKKLVHSLNFCAKG
jgi:threonine dehydrogenase-like Zn-dependent dehydrogenase